MALSSRSSSFMHQGASQHTWTLTITRPFSLRTFFTDARAGKNYDCPIRFPFTEPVTNTELIETSKHASDLIEKFNPRRPDTFVVDFYDEGATHEALLNIINDLRMARASSCAIPVTWMVHSQTSPYITANAKRIENPDRSNHQSRPSKQTTFS